MNEEGWTSRCLVALFKGCVKILLGSQDGKKQTIIPQCSSCFGKHAVTFRPLSPEHA